ncbi:MAG TPA: adenylyltransferase/cytidyltransferase family protein [Casimicrobiaceae bacterium]|nr:adenylyltransferase/cytidyltransferase family protein [Casimicrobiaceae bacterium]
MTTRGTAPEPGFAAKIATRAALAERLPALPRPRVFTNGVFDILHRGHVTYLDRARSLGASLIVGVNTDASVRSLGKGNDRPVNALDDRLAVLAALEAVSLVVAFDEDTPLTLVLACHPDIIVKGGDYSAATTVGAAEVIAWGGRFEAVPIVPDCSTTALLARMRG